MDVGRQDQFEIHDRLDPDEIVAVITFLKSLWSAEQRRYQIDRIRDDGFPTKVVAPRRP